jgi:hypothetical protein
MLVISNDLNQSPFPPDLNATSQDLAITPLIHNMATSKRSKRSMSRLISARIKPSLATSPIIDLPSLANVASPIPCAGARNPEAREAASLLRRNAIAVWKTNPNKPITATPKVTQGAQPEESDGRPQPADAAGGITSAMDRLKIAKPTIDRRLLILHSFTPLPRMQRRASPQAYL